LSGSESLPEGVTFSRQTSVMRIALMITCLGDVLRPAAGIATVNVLRHLGHSVDFPEAQTCCGQPLFNSGFHDLAR
jgi:L-lactate dehydrogenase complex protein LldE